MMDRQPTLTYFASIFFLLLNVSFMDKKVTDYGHSIYFWFHSVAFP
uniref:Uncharacterized protein n=1 Tax=Rhizophora mucronata TaxID=61149 RepID=A0A2P2NFY4_RHIMU